MKGNSGLFDTSGGSNGGDFLQTFGSETSNNPNWDKISEKGRKIRDQVQNKSLQNAITELYRNSPNKVGDGSTAAALKAEYKSGKQVKNKNHIMKAHERIKQMSKLINSNVLSKKDVKIAKREIRKLQKILNKIEKGKQ